MRTRIALFALTTALFTTAFGGFLSTTRDGDMDIHIQYAADLTSFRDLTSPHFLFQLLLKALVSLTGLEYRAGAALLLGLCYGAMALLIAREIDRRGAALSRAGTLLLIPAVLIACHIFLATLSPPSLYLGYFVPITYHSPTQSLNKLFALWVSFTYFSTFLAAGSPTVRRSLALGGLCALSAIAKPSFLVAFLPAAAIFGARDVFRLRWDRVAMFGTTVGLVVPVLLWQTRVAYGSAAEASVILAPFAVFNAQDTLVRLPLSLAFPLVVAAAAYRGRAWTGTLAFTWVFTAIALVVTLFVAEGGERLGQGNFAWTGQTAVFLAYVESLLFLLARPVGAGWRRAAWIVFAIHVACGIAWYALAFSRSWHDVTGI